MYRPTRRLCASGRVRKICGRTVADRFRSRGHVGHDDHDHAGHEKSYQDEQGKESELRHHAGRRA